MSVEDRARVVLFWHLHQPEYRVDGVPLLPWAYLHALRGYTDMASHLEAVPGARAVVNFSPVLLDQLLDLAQQARDALSGSTILREPLREPLMAALLASPPPAQRAATLRACLRTHARNAQDRYADYARLAQMAQEALDAGDAAVAALPAQSVDDLVVWYHLVWLAESVRKSDPRSADLIARRRDFSAADRHGLLTLIAELLTTLIPRWRALAQSGRVELSCNPYYHPLLPLLLDFHAARENAPGVPLPTRQYPQGEARARWHLDRGRERFRELFGIKTRGVWPSEAAVSDATVRLLHEEGFAWFVTSQSVQNASLHYHGETLDRHSCTYRMRGNGMACFFRDDGLSDRIGFVYKDWQPRDAVTDLVHHIDQLAQQRGGRTVVIALDGENPWEYYPENGIEFIRGLYAALVDHPRLRPATFSQCVDEGLDDAPELPSLIAGSWVHGELLTWVGHGDKNRAWELLMDAADACAGQDSEAVRHLLGACEGSDWFWWPGAGHADELVADFDAAFRAHLRRLYAALGKPAPAILDQPFTHARDGGAQTAALGAMMPSHAMHGGLKDAASGGQPG